MIHATPPPKLLIRTQGHEGSICGVVCVVFTDPKEINPLLGYRQSLMLEREDLCGDHRLVVKFDKDGNVEISCEEKP
jgi:hypothetical protein